MRKLLLASAAMLGAASGIASAQAPTPAAANMMMQPSQGQMALPWVAGPAANNNNNTYGQPSTYMGPVAVGKNAVPTPGTVVIRLNGRVEVDMMAQWGTGNNSVPVGFKINPVEFGAYMRLYPGVDGMATNGMRYGAAVELRNSSPGQTAQPAPAQGGATGAASATSAALGAAAPAPTTNNQGQTVYVRRAFTYLAADNVGLIRFGMTDGVIGLFDPGIFYGGGYDAGVGNINGGQIQGQAPGANFVPYYFLAQGGAEYTNIKVVYLSPQFFGLDFGVQYAPSMGNGFSGCSGGQQAGFGCTAATTGNDPTRWYNQVAVGLRWQGDFGMVKPAAYVVYETAGKENYFGPQSSSGRGFLGTRYDNLSFVSAAALVVVDTPFGQFTPAVDWIGGAINGGGPTMRPSGGIAQSAIVGSLNYKNGPVNLGVQAVFVTSQGAAQLTSISQRNEFELAAGGTYTLAPGMFLVGEYQYHQRHQTGFDFNAGAVSTGTGTPGTATWRPGLTRDAHAQAIMFSTVVTW